MSMQGFRLSLVGDTQNPVRVEVSVNAWVLDQLDLQKDHARGFLNPEPRRVLEQLLPIITLPQEPHEGLFSVHIRNWQAAANEGNPVSVELLLATDFHQFRMNLRLYPSSGLYTVPHNEDGVPAGASVCAENIRQHDLVEHEFHDE